MQYGQMPPQPVYGTAAAAPASPYGQPPAAAPAPVAGQDQYRLQPQQQQQQSQMMAPQPAMYPTLATEGTQFDYSYQKDVRQLPPPPRKTGSTGTPGTGAPGSAAYEEFYQ
jgi:hypothetical protein